MYLKYKEQQQMTLINFKSFVVLIVTFIQHGLWHSCTNVNHSAIICSHMHRVNT